MRGGGVPTGEDVTEGKDVITEIESSDTLDSCDREDTKHDMIMTINIYQAKSLKWSVPPPRSGVWELRI